MRRKFVILVAAVALWGGLSSAQANVHAVTNGNSFIFVDPSDEYGGLINWFVDNTSQVVQQWYWYRESGDTQEFPLNNLALISDTDNGTSQISLTYSNTASWTVNIKFTLTGGPLSSGISTIVKDVTFHNFSASPLTLAWFEFHDFDLSGVNQGGDDSAFGGVNGITQTDGTTTVNVTHSITPGAFQIAAGDPFAIFDVLQDSNLDNLDNSGNPSGPDDITFAFQWSLVIPGGGTTTITTTEAIPEPSTLVLTGFALCALLLARRRRSRAA